MEWATTTLALCGVGAAALATSAVTLRRRLDLSQAKHRSLAGHARIARRLAALVPSYGYDEARFFCSDGAPAEVAARRRAGFEQLAAQHRSRFAETIRRTAEAAAGISDLQFTAAYRVPFQYSEYVRAHLPAAAFVQSSDGVVVTDLGMLEPRDGELALTRLHPGVSVEEAQEATGWDLRIADDLGETDPPTEAELEVLRSLRTKGSA